MSIDTHSWTFDRSAVEWLALPILRTAAPRVLQRIEAWLANKLLESATTAGATSSSSGPSSSASAASPARNNKPASRDLV